MDVTTTSITAVSGSTSSPISIVAPPKESHSHVLKTTVFPRMTDRRVSIASTVAAVSAPMVLAAARSGQRLRKGRMTRAIRTKEPSGSRNMAQTAASVTIYSFLSISSATCSRPLGT